MADFATVEEAIEEIRNGNQSALKFINYVLL